MGADIIGVRINDGEIKMSQRYYSGVELSAGVPIVGVSDDMFREFTFSGKLPGFVDIDLDNSVTIFETCAYVGIGGSIRIAFDLDNFTNKLKNIKSLYGG